MEKYILVGFFLFFFFIWDVIESVNAIYNMPMEDKNW